MTKGRLKRKRCFYSLNDRRLKILDLTPASEIVFDERYRCTEMGFCRHLSPRWHERPEPINVVVRRVTSAWVEGIAGTDIGTDLTTLDSELLDALAPYCRGMVFGKVLLDRGEGRPEPTRFATVTAPKFLRIQSDRGQYCVHWQHPCCGVVVNSVGWAKGAIVERTLDDRLVYVDQDGSILVADELVQRLGLKERFSKLWLQRIDVVPEPLDKETLPGDPGWDGQIRRTYHAWLDVMVSVPYTATREREERTIYDECERRLNRELQTIGAEAAFRHDRGSHGSCMFCARGVDTSSLKEAAIRALSNWRVPARFTIVVDLVDNKSNQPVDKLELSGDAA